MRNERILIAPNDIAGYYGKLEIGLKALGYSVVFANLYATQSGYHFEKSRWKLVTKAQQAVARSKKKSNPLIAKLRLTTTSIYFFSFLTLIYSLPKIDTYIFVYGRSFLPWNLDLVLLRFFRKKTICVVGHGNEARPPYLSYNGLSSASDEISIELTRKLFLMTRRMKKQLSRIEKHSTYVVGSSCTCQLLSKQFVDIAALRQPVDFEEFRSAERNLGDTIKILHCPSDPVVKGSIEIRKIIERVREIYPKVEFIEVTGLSNSKVLSIISSVDLIIDQLWSDSPMSMIGYEAASLGKPSLTFGAALKTLKVLDQQIPLPLYGYFSSESALETIIHFVSSEVERTKLAELQQSFVIQHASSRQVAQNFARIIDGQIPDNWLVDPKDCFYSGGSGLPPEVSLNQMKAMSESYGIESLLWMNANVVLSDLG